MRAHITSYELLCIFCTVTSLLRQIGTRKHDVRNGVGLATLALGRTSDANLREQTLDGSGRRGVCVRSRRDREA